MAGTGLASVIMGAAYLGVAKQIPDPAGQAPRLVIWTASL